MPFLSDLDHYKIETEILEDGNEVVSYEYITNVGLGLRNAKCELRWYRQANIGQGSCSNVWLEIQKGNSEAKRAVKAISKKKLLEINVDYTRELEALTEFSKPKYRQKGVFVDFLGWWDNPDSVFLAMEYFPIGTLEDSIASGPFDEQVNDVMVQLFEGLEIMHAEGFAHRDLKPANIFVVQKDPKWWVKIGDFGISKRIRNQDTSLRTFTGTHDYMAPEFFGYVDGIDDERSDYTHAVDIWALGCVVYKLWTHTVPFPSYSNLRPLQRYCSGRDPFPVEALLSTRCTDVEITIIEALLNVEPSKRPSAKAALEMVQYSAAAPPAIHYSPFSQGARSRVGTLDQGRGSASDQATFNLGDITSDYTVANKSLTTQREIEKKKPGFLIAEHLRKDLKNIPLTTLREIREKEEQASAEEFGKDLIRLQIREKKLEQAWTERFRKDLSRVPTRREIREKELKQASAEQFRKDLEKRSLVTRRVEKEIRTRASKGGTIYYSA